MGTLTRHSTMVVVMTLALGVMALPARGDVVSGGPKVGQLGGACVGEPQCRHVEMRGASSA